VERLSRLFDFRVELGQRLLPRSYGAFKSGYVVTITHVAGTELQDPHTIGYFPLTEEGYSQADAMAQRLVIALEVSTQPTRTGLPRSGLAVDYLREMRTHEVDYLREMHPQEEAVE
jgi:hypothetical protein